jgi:hypothetical protein
MKSNRPYNKKAGHPPGLLLLLVPTPSSLVPSFYFFFHVVPDGPSWIATPIASS